MVAMSQRLILERVKEVDSKVHISTEGKVNLAFGG